MAEGHTRNYCDGDGWRCYVGKGKDAHHRCGTVQCGRNKPLEVPDRLSADLNSEFYNAMLACKIRVKFNGELNSDVIEYCISEKWIKVVQRHPRTGEVVVCGRGNDRRILNVFKVGLVEAFFEE